MLQVGHTPDLGSTCSITLVGSAHTKFVLPLLDREIPYQLLDQEDAKMHLYLVVKETSDNHPEKQRADMDYERGVRGIVTTIPTFYEEASINLQWFKYSN